MITLRHFTIPIIPSGIPYSFIICYTAGRCTESKASRNSDQNQQFLEDGFCSVLATRPDQTNYLRRKQYSRHLPVGRLQGSCCEQIFTLRQIMEKVIAGDGCMAINFVDLRKARIRQSNMNSEWNMTRVMDGDNSHTSSLASIALLFM